MSSSEADVNAELGANSKTVLNSTCPVAKFCYYCKRVVWTKIKHYPTLRTRIMALGLSPCLLCWVPFFCHWKAELDHHCSFCDQYLGTYNPLHENKTPRMRIPSEVGTEEKKQPQKKYREAGRRCLEHGEAHPHGDEIIRVYKQCPGLI